MNAITVKEYAKLRGIGEAAVRKAIKMGHALPGVVKKEKFGKAHALYVDKRKLRKDLEVTK